MIEPIEVLVVFAVASAFAAVLLGEVLSRSIVVASAALTAFGLACLAAGGGVVALCVAIVGLLSLSIVQLFGWMLVDIDHDHLPRVSFRTASARGLALAGFASGLALLAREAMRRGEFDFARSPGEPLAGFDLDLLGAFFFGSISRGSIGALPVVLGCLIAAGLLTALCLLQDDGTDAG